MPKVSNFKLLNVPLENDYKHTLHFTSKLNQQTFFESKAIKTLSDVSFIRKDQPIRFEGNFDFVLSHCNYVMYQNVENGKVYYAFITDVRYVNDGRVDIDIETDCIQTWYFDYAVLPSFIEREHVNDDRAGLHTVPESLETGEYICSKCIPYNPLTHTKCVVVASTLKLDDEEALNDSTGNVKFPNVEGGLYNNIPTGFRYYAYKSDAEATLPIYRAGQKGQAEGIYAVFLAPREFVDIGENGRIPDSVLVNSKSWIGAKYGDNLTQESIEKPISINGYTPNNNKLLTFPYIYCLMSNNSGSGAVYKYEHFVSNLLGFKINFALTPGCSIRLIPQNYKGVQYNNEEGLNGGKFPVCSWNTDVYTNWLTQNAINIPVKIAGDVFNVAMGGASIIGGAVMTAGTGGVGGAVGGGAIAGGVTSIASGVQGIASTIGEKYQHSLQPNQASGNLNSGDVTFSNHDLTFTAYQMNIKTEYALIIDKYFDMFGYKVNMVKIPNKEHRSRYWYTKTIDVNIDGSIPNKDLQIIKNCYNNGITFWRNANEIQNYSLTNDIV